MQQYDGLVFDNEKFPPLRGHSLRALRLSQPLKVCHLTIIAKLKCVEVFCKTVHMVSDLFF